MPPLPTFKRFRYYIIIPLIFLLTANNLFAARLSRVKEKKKEHARKARYFAGFQPSISSPVTGPTSTRPIPIIITPTRITSEITQGDLTVSNAQLNGFTRNYQVTYNSLLGSSGSGNSQFNNIQYVYVDKNGWIYVSDDLNNRVQVFDANKTFKFQLGDGTSGSGAGQLNSPYGIVTDANNKILVVDQLNNRVQVFDPTTHLPIGQFGSAGSGDGEFNSPTGISIDSNGYIYVADSENNRIEVFDPSYHFSYEFGSSQLNHPLDVKIDPDHSGGTYNNNIYIADSDNNRVIAYANSGNNTAPTSVIRTYTSTYLIHPTGICFDGVGNLQVASNDFDIKALILRKSDGYQLASFTTSGPGQLDQTRGIATDGKGNIYIGDLFNNHVVKLTVSDGYTATLAPLAVGQISVTLPQNTIYDAFGNYNAAANFFITYALPTLSTSINGTSGTVAISPIPITVDVTKPADEVTASNFILTNATIANLQHTFTATYKAGFGGPGGSGFAPTYVAVDNNGSIYVAEGHSDIIYVFNEDGVLQRSIGSKGSGPGQFSGITGIACDGTYLYVSERYNNRVQKLTTAGGSPVSIGVGRLNSPASVFVAGNKIYVADQGNNYIRVFDIAGSYLSGSSFGGAAGSADGQLSAPTSVFADAAGYVYVGDKNNQRIQKFDAAGVFNSVLTTSGQVSNPTSIASDGTGKFYVADADGKRIRIFTLSGNLIGTISSVGGGSFGFPQGIAVDKNGKIYVADQSNHLIDTFTGAEQYTADLTPTADGTVEAKLVANTIYDAAGNGNPLTSYSVVYNGAPPAKPTGVTPTSLDGQIKIDWTANPAGDLVSQYKIYGGTTNSPTDLIATVPSTQLTYTNTGLTNGTIYYYRITAVDDIGHESDSSDVVSSIPKADQTITINPITKTFGDPVFNLDTIAHVGSGLAISYSFVSGPATLSGSNVTITGAGLVKIKANQTGNQFFNAAPEQEISFTVAKATPALTWNVSAHITYGTPLAAAVAKDVSGNLMSGGNYAYDDSGLAKAPGDILLAGTHTLIATFTPQASDQANYTTGSKTITVIVDKKAPDLTWDLSSPITYGMPFPTAVAKDINGNAMGAGSYAYSDGATAIASSNILTAGSHTLTVTFTPQASDLANYTTTSTTQTLLVNKATPTIVWSDPSPITVGKPLTAVQLNARATGIDGHDLLGGTFDYGDLPGKVLGLGTQPLDVTFTPSVTDQANYTSAAKTVHIEVNNKATQTITFNQIPDKTYGDVVNLASYASIDSPLPLSFAVSGPATIAPGTSNLTVNGIGSVTVTASQSGDADYNPAQPVSITFTVGKATPVITWTPPNIIYGTPLGGSQLNAEAKINGVPVAGNFDYGNQSGKVLNAGAGQTLTATFTPQDPSTYNSVSGITATIDVAKADPQLVWNLPGNISYGTTLAQATAKDVSGNAMTGGSYAYEELLPVAGSLTAGAVLDAGTYSLRVTFTPQASDQNNYNTKSLTLPLTVDQKAPVLTWNLSSPLTYGDALPQATAKDANGNVMTGTYAYKELAPAVQSLTTGAQLNAGSYTLEVTFTPQGADATNYTAKTLTGVSATVNKATPTIVWTDPLPALTYGDALPAGDLNAQAKDISGNVMSGTNYAYDDAGNAVSAGTILTAGPHTLHVKYTPEAADQGNYTTGEGTTHITVGKATPVITWTPPNIIYGTPLGGSQLNAEAKINGVPVAGNFDYGNQSGKVLNAGAGQTLTATFTPQDPSTYNSVSGITATIDVAKADPQLVWNLPGNISYGTTLAQATAKDVSGNAMTGGSYAYEELLPVAGSLTAGAVLDAGTYSLRVTFTPQASDQNNYNTKSLTLPLTVDQKAPVLTWNLSSPLTYGDALPQATAKDANGNVMTGTYAYKELAPAVQSLTTGAQLNAGSYTLEVTFTPQGADATNYTAKTLTGVSATVNKATPTIVWTDPLPALTYGDALPAGDLNAQAKDISGNVMSGTNYAYDDAGNAVSAGTILTAGPHTLHVKYTPEAADQGNYTTGEGTTHITVGKATPVITWTPPNIIYGTPLGGSQLNAEAKINGVPVAGNFDYGNQSGKVLNAGAGQTLTATFTPQDPSTYNSVSGITATIDVAKADPQLVWNLPGNISYGTTLAQATAKDVSGNAMTGGSYAYEELLPVAGSLTAGAVLDAGTYSLRVTFTPQASDQNNYNTKSLTLPLTVDQKAPVLTWNLSSPLTYGDALPQATAKDANGNVMTGTYAYKELAPAVQSLTTGAQLNAGSYTLEVTFTPQGADATNYTAKTLTGVSATVNKATPTIVWTDPLPALTYGDALPAGDLNAQAKDISGNVMSGTNYAYDDAGHAVSAGTILTAGSHTLHVKYTPEAADQGNYTTGEGTTHITVGKATPVITWTPPNIIYGTPLGGSQLNAEAKINGVPVAGNFDYGNQSGKVLNAGAGQTLTATFTPQDPSTYNSVSGITATIDVAKADPQLVWNLPGNISYGTTLAQATAKDVSGNAMTGGSYAYEELLPVAGSLTAGAVLDAGTYSLRVTFTPQASDQNNYNTKSLTLPLTVDQKAPVLTWNLSSPLTYGDALPQATAKDANGNVMTGTYAYKELAPAVQSLTTGAQLNAGSYTLEVTFTPQGADATNYTAKTLTGVSATVNKATPTIVWTDPLPALTYGDALPAGDLNAQAKDISGNVMSGTNYAYDDAGNAVSAGTILTAGPHTLHVKYTPEAADQGNYTTGEGTTHITVGKATPVITWTPPNIIYGTPLGGSQLNAEAKINGVPVAGNFDYGNQSGKVLNAGAGQTLTATFTPQDPSTYNSVSGITATIDVAKADPQLVWNLPGNISYGTTLAQATAKDVSGNAMTGGSYAYEELLPVAGSLTAGAVLDAGTYSLRVTFTPQASDQNNYNTKSLTLPLTVDQKAPVLTWNLSSPLTYGDALPQATAKDANGNVMTGTYAYKELAPAVQSLTTGAQLNAGSYTLEVTFTPQGADATNYTAKTLTGVSATVNKATPTIVWNTPSPITQGMPLTSTELSAKANGINGSQLAGGTYAYEDEAGNPIAVGTVLPLGSHTLHVRFTSQISDQANYNSNTQQVTLIVNNKQTQTITFNQIPPATYGNGPINLDNYASVNSGLILSYGVVSGNATVSGHTLTITGAGQVEVSADQSGDANYNRAQQKTVTFNVSKATPTILWSAPSAITQGMPLSNTQLNAVAQGIAGQTLTGTFVYAPAAGAVLPVGNNKALQVTFTPDDQNNYQTGHGQTTIDVNNKITPTIAWATPSPITYGTPLDNTQLNATAKVGSVTVAGHFDYGTLPGKVLNAGANQTLSANFIPDDPSTYNGVNNSTVQITVLKAQPNVVWSTPLAITQGIALSATQLNAQAQGVDGHVLPGTYVYAPAAGTVLSAGSGQQLTVTFTPTDQVNYQTGQGQTTIDVNNKLTPVIAWATPQDITYGTALNNNQLNATVSGIAGTFSYSPSAGTVLNAGGGQILSVIFTPNDQATYNTVTKTAAINVVKATPVITWANPSPIAVGAALSATQLNASVTGIPGTFTYTPGIGTVLSAGNGQTLSVTFTPTDVANYNAVTKTVIIDVNSLTPVITWNNPADINYGVTLSSGQLNATVNVPGTFVYNPSAGAVLNAGAHTLSVTFTPFDNVTYSTVTKTVTINVNKVPLTVTVNNAARQYGAADPTFTAYYTGFVNGDTETNSFATLPSISTTATSTSNVGIYPISAGGGVSNNYSLLYVNGILTITPTTRSLTFNALADKTYGDADFDPGAITSSNETIIYSSANTNVATIVNGKVHIIGAGTTIITATLPMNTNYSNTPFISQSLVVNKANQTIALTSIPTLNRGDKYDLSVIKSSSGLPITFKTIDQSIATVQGLDLNAVHIGVTNIIASQPGDNNYNAANDVITQVIVKDGNGNEFIVHQALSPNGDGINDFLYIEGIQQYANNRITIIDRNGSKVYEISGYDNANKVFDGHSNITGQLLTPGTYFYLVEYINEKGEGRHKTGYFVLKY